MHFRGQNERQNCVEEDGAQRERNLGVRGVCVCGWRKGGRGWNVCVLCGYCKSLLLVLWHCIKLMHAKFNRRENRTEREQEREEG